MTRLPHAALCAIGALLTGCVLRGPVTRTFSFMPKPLPGARALPATYGFMDAALDTIAAADSGVQLHAWWIPSSREPARCGAALLLHGKGQNRAELAPLARTLSSAGFDVLVPDYRGYGGSTGRPTDSGVTRDADAAYAHLRTRVSDPRVPIVIVGHSMGTALAAHLAARERPAATVYLAPFSTATRLTRARFGMLSAALFDSTWFDFAPARDAARANVRTLVGIAGRDRLITAGVSEEFVSAIAPRPPVIRDPRATHAGILTSPMVLRATRDSLRVWLHCSGAVQREATH